MFVSSKKNNNNTGVLCMAASASTYLDTQLQRMYSPGLRFFFLRRGRDGRRNRPKFILRDGSLD